MGVYAVLLTDTRPLTSYFVSGGSRWKGKWEKVDKTCERLTEYSYTDVAMNADINCLIPVA